MCFLRRALLCLFSGRESPGGRAERRQLPGGERRHCGGHGLFPPQEGDDLGYKVFTRYNQVIRWKRSVAVCFSCLGKVECSKGRLALCVLHALNTSQFHVAALEQAHPCLVNSLQWWKPHQYQLGELPFNNLGVSCLQNQGSTWPWLPTITLWIFTTSLPARGLAFAKVPPATSPTSTGTPEVKCWPEVQTGNAHEMEYQETVPLQLLGLTTDANAFPMERCVDPAQLHLLVSNFLSLLSSAWQSLQEARALQGLGPC